MPTIRLKGFLGYTSKVDQVQINPLLALSAKDTIINNGDLCNIPYPKSLFNTAPFDTNSLKQAIIQYPDLEKEPTLFVYVKNDSTGIARIYHTNKFIDLASSSFQILGEVDSVEIIPTILGIDLTKDPNGNMLQIGDWVFHVGLFGNIGSNDSERASRNTYPNMLRYKVESLQNIGDRLVPKVTPIGIKPFLNFVQIKSIGGTMPLGTYQIALSQVSDIDNRVRSGSLENKFVVLRENDLESTAIVSSIHTLTVGSAGLEIIVNKNIHDPLANSVTNTLLSFYIRQDPQVDYYFWGYAVPTSETDTTFTYRMEKFQQDLTRTAPLTDVLPIHGAHDRPRSCHHIAFYKNRAYYSSASFSGELIPTTLKKRKNLLQISAKNPLLDPNIAKYACYIEKEELVGNDGEFITGLQEYLGQLVIFKETETHVLTAPLDQGGEIRSLFPDLGCVNVDGGHAYLVIENRLFFGDRDGIYMYSGEANPVKISDLIEEDLNNIDRQVYKTMRFSHDPRYGLLFVSFMSLNEPTYIFHYKEEGIVWTTSFSKPIKQVLTRQLDSSSVDRQVYYITDNDIQESTLLEENSIGGFNRPLLWEGGFTDFNSLERKHWKTLEIISRTIFTGQNWSLIVSVLDPDFSIDTFNLTSKFHIGLRARELRIHLQATEITKAFRIAGFELTTHRSRKRSRK